jgi:hypothetical protein
MIDIQPKVLNFKEYFSSTQSSGEPDYFQEQYHIAYLTSSGEEGGGARLSVRSAVGASELEQQIKAILSEYGDAAQMQVFQGERLVVTSPKRKSVLEVSVELLEGSIMVQTGSSE